MKQLLFLLFALLPSLLEAGEKASLASPDGRLVFSFTQRDGDGLYYTLARDGKIIVEESRLGVAIDNHLQEAALAIPGDEPQYRGDGWCRNLRFIGEERATVDTTWTPPYGEWAAIPDRYNELLLRFMKGQHTAPDAKGYVKEKCYYLNIRVRAYNEGLAFCYEFPETSNGLFLHLTDELTEFRLHGSALCTAWAQGEYQWRSLEEPWDEQAERPLTVRLTSPLSGGQGGAVLSILEARLTDYVRTKFAIPGGGVVKAVPYSSADVITPFTTPWRLIMVADRMVDLCNHDYMVLNLNAPQALDETSWIRPGKVFRSDLNRKALYEAVDFAASHGLDYIHLDAGWYGPEMKMSSSATAVDTTRNFTMSDIVGYAATKGIGVLAYVNQRALSKDLDGVLDSLAAWGVRGVKFGFVQVGNQQWTTWLHRAIAAAAERHLMVDIHDEYRPTGFSRTYPNLMTAEGIRGNEEMPTATHNVTLPFTRFLCGPADYTLCYYNGRLQTTRAHQLAMAAVYYSPLTWMYWYDKPRQVKDGPELEYWKQIPTVWDDTRVLQGEPGEYIVTARRSGQQWFVGVMTGNESRTVTLPLSFLTAKRKYTAHIYEDGHDKTVTVTTRTVTGKTTLTLPLKASGGAAIMIAPSK